MTTHSFTLIVEGVDINDPDVFDALYEAGCDDATIGVTNGIPVMDFDREAASFNEAILSAIADAESVESLRVVRIADPDLVSMSEIAARIGRSRECVRLWVLGKRGPGGFPPPLNDPHDRYRFWRWSDVEGWLRGVLGGEPWSSDDHLRAAINATLELRHHLGQLDPQDCPDLRALAGPVLGG
ncbi:helix-turn-helix transcriptional regulator [Candidatus Palauibacter sp.]|uniref:helix-turn-helix transcriptional regulator n=1 Tax=Candidatus Palauibacter sp. TaxID=3101350 RepID=UPI003C6FFAF5